MKSITYLLLVALIILTACDDRPPKEPTASEKSSQLKKDRTLEIAKKYPGLLNWDDYIGQSFIMTSLEAQRTFLTNAPLLIEASLEDIQNEDGKNYALFSGTFLDLKIELSDEQLNTIMKDGCLAQWELVVRLLKIKKINSVSALVENGGESSVKIAREGFYAEGLCLDYFTQKKKL